MKKTLNYLLCSLVLLSGTSCQSKGKNQPDAKLAEKGAKLHDKYCEKCHSEGGKIIEGIFKGETINTPSMLAVEDYLLAIDHGDVCFFLPGPLLHGRPLVVENDAVAAQLPGPLAQLLRLARAADEPLVPRPRPHQ